MKWSFTVFYFLTNYRWVFVCNRSRIKYSRVIRACSRFRVIFNSDAKVLLIIITVCYLLFCPRRSRRRDVILPRRWRGRRSNVIIVISITTRWWKKKRSPNARKTNRRYDIYNVGVLVQRIIRDKENGVWWNFFLLSAESGIKRLIPRAQYICLYIDLFAICASYRCFLFYFFACPHAFD